MLLRRFFVTLKPDDDEYSIEGEKPDGFFKFERFGNRCRVTINVTGLKQPEDFSYKGMLVGFKNNEPVMFDMGVLKIDDMGRCISQWLFDPENIEGKGIRLEDLKVCAVVVDNLNGQLITPLVGLIDGDYADWKKMIKHDKDTSIDESKSSENLVPELPNIDIGEDGDSQLEQKLEQNGAYVEKLDHDEGESGFDHAELQEDKEDKTDQSSEKNISEQNNISERNISESEAENLIGSLELKDQGVPGESQYVRNLKKYIGDIIGHLQEVQPFEEKMEGYKWWKIENGYAFNKDHYLMGLVFEQNKVKYIVYAMPGKFNMFDQPYGGLTGFVCWRPARGQQFEYDADGYWLMHIDALTGQIVMPLKPTPPPLFKGYD